MSAPPAETPPSTIPYVSLAILAGAGFASSASIRVSDPLLPQVAAEFAVTAGQASIIITAFTVAYGLLQIVYGALGDRLGKYRTIIATTMLAAAGSLACALAPTLTTLTIARFVTAAVSCGVIPLALAWVGDVVPYDRRQRVLARFIAGQISGLIFGQIAGGILGDWLGWRAVFAVLAGLHVLAGLAMLARMAFDPATRRRAAVLAAPTRSLWRAYVDTFGLLKRPWVRRVVGAVALEGFLFFGAFAYVGNELKVRFAVDYTVVGLSLAIYGLGGLVYATASGWLVRVLGETGLARAGGALVGAAFLILAVAPTLPVAVAAIALIGLGFYMMHNTLQTHGTQMAPEARGAAVSVFGSALFLSQSISVALAAPVIDRFGAAPVFAVAGVAIPVLGFAIAAGLRRRAA